MAAYEALVASGTLQRDGVQVEVLSEFERLYDALEAYEPAPLPPIEEMAEAKPTIGSALARWAAQIGLAIGGGSDRPSGASGPVVSRFGAPKAEQPKLKPKEERRVDYSGIPRGVYVYGGVGSGKSGAPSSSLYGLSARFQ